MMRLIILLVTLQNKSTLISGMCSEVPRDDSKISSREIRPGFGGIAKMMLQEKTMNLDSRSENFKLIKNM